MSDITASLRISVQATKPDSLEATYVREVGSGAVNTMMKDWMPVGRIVKPSAMTYASTGDVFTLPAGTVFLLSSGSEVFRCELLAAVTLTVPAAGKVYLLTGKDVHGLLGVILDTGSSYPTGSLALGVASDSDVFTEDTGLNKVTPKKVYCEAVLAAVAVNGSVYAYVPSAGTITKVGLTHGGNIGTTGNVTVTTKVAGLACNGGVLALVNNAAPGSVVTNAPTSNNTVAQDTAIEFAVALNDPANNTVGALTIVAEVTQ